MAQDSEISLKNSGFMYRMNDAASAIFFRNAEKAMNRQICLMVRTIGQMSAGSLP